MVKMNREIYGGKDPRNLPMYNFAEASRYVRVAPATLRSWALGREYPMKSGTAFFRPLIELPESNQRMLSFWNLVEMHVLKGLRTKHGISMKDVRTAIDISEQEHKIQRLLLSPELYAGAGDLLLEKYGELVHLSISGQMAMKKVLESYLDRVIWEEDLPVRLFPLFPRLPDPSSKLITIDPLIGFGRPVVLPHCISTSAIVDRIDANESIDEIAKDYGIDQTTIEAVILYERAA